jgi:hypothetical protein
MPYTALLLTMLSLQWALVLPTGEESPVYVKAAILEETDHTFSHDESAVRNYIVESARRIGIDPTRAEWIARHESQFGLRMRGDSGHSRGYWMISSIYHPEVSTSCADDLKCSTEWALHRMRRGFIHEWATWSLRCQRYKNAPECPE